MRQLAPIAVLLAALVLAPAAGARVVVVASGDGAATLTDVNTNQVVARVPVGGRSRAVAAAPDGTRAYVAAGTRVVAVDLGARTVAGATPVPGTPTAVAASSDGQRVYAARPGGLDVIDAPTMTLKASITLGRRARPTSLAVAHDGTIAAVTLDSKHVAIVDLERFHLRKRMAVARPAAVAFAPHSDAVWVSASGRLVRFGPTGRLLGRWNVGKSVGGGGLAW
ncbi:MAG TPA: hypothetical protein VKB54_08625, partial [Solirubrobacteraceae bacterium]|nr:hypothetical protein [Solirubrobacteraceae bacterium]